MYWFLHRFADINIYGTSTILQLSRMDSIDRRHWCWWVHLRHPLIELDLMGAVHFITFPSTNCRPISAISMNDERTFCDRNAVFERIIESGFQHCSTRKHPRRWQWGRTFLWQTLFCSITNALIASIQCKDFTRWEEGGPQTPAKILALHRVWKYWWIVMDL